MSSRKTTKPSHIGMSAANEFTRQCLLVYTKVTVRKNNKLMMLVPALIFELKRLVCFPLSVSFHSTFSSPGGAVPHNEKTLKHTRDVVLSIPTILMIMPNSLHFFGVGVTLRTKLETG